MNLLNIFINVSRISPLVGAAINLALGALVISLGKRSQQNLLFFIFSIIVSAWAFSCFIQSITRDAITAEYWDIILYVFAIFCPAYLLRLSESFLRESYDRLFYLLIGIGVLLQYFNFTHDFRKGVSFNFGARFVTVPGIGWYFFAVIFGATMSFVLWILYKGIKDSPKQHKDRIKKLFISFLILIIGGNSYFILVLYKFTPLVDSVLNLTASIFTGIYGISIAYLILKEDLLNVNLIVSKTLSYVVILFLSGISMGTALYAVGIEGPYIIGWGIFTGLILTFFGDPVRRSIQTAAENKWIKGSYNSATFISELSKKIKHVQNRSTVFEHVVDTLNYSVQPEHVIAILATRAQDKIVKYDIYHKKDRIFNDLPITSELIQYIYANPTIKPLNILKAQLSPDLKIPSFKSIENGILLPFFSPDGLECVLLLDQKSVEEPYNKTDIDFLDQLETIVSSLLYKLTPYEQIEKEFYETKKKLYDAEIMRIQAQKNKDLAHTIQEYNHEIRTPLQAIMTAAEYLPDTLSEKSIILKNTDRANDIITTTLKLAQESELSYDKKTSILAINDILREAVAEYHFKPSIEIKWQGIDTQNLKIIGQEKSLKMIIANLLKNADEAMPDGGQVILSMGIESDEVWITVKDTGTGIKEADIQKIWEPYRSSHVTKGRGLGLSIVHKIIREHEGRISVESKWGEGALFKIYFPLVKEFE